MIICNACGRPNEDDAEFCEDCGRYLAWSGERVEAPEEPEPEVEPEVVEEPAPRPGFFRRVGMRLHLVASGEPEGDAPPTVRSEETLESSDPPPSAAPPAPDSAAATGAPVVVVGADPDTIAIARVVVENPSAAQDGSGELDGELEQDGPDALTTLEPAADGTGRTMSALMLVESETPAPRGLIALRRPNEVETTRPTRTRRRTTASPLSTGPDVPRAGDVFCPVCNQFNSPTRVFCRRCGTELNAAALTPPPAYSTLPFWHRHFRRDVRIASAGTRPGHWGRAASGGGGTGAGMRFMARAGMLVTGAFVVVSFIGPAAQPLRNWYSSVYHSIVNKVDVQYSQQFPIGANASSTTPGHAAGLAVDGASNTYWMSLANLKTNGVGQSITVVFAAPTAISRIGVLSGAGPSAKLFLSQSRAEDIDISFNKTTLHEKLDDTASFQKLAVNIPPVLSVTFTVQSVYRSATGHRVAITELEFFQRT